MQEFAKETDKRGKKALSMRDVGLIGKKKKKKKKKAVSVVSTHEYMVLSLFARRCVLVCLWKAELLPWLSLAFFSDANQICENQHPFNYILLHRILEIRM